MKVLKSEKRKVILILHPSVKINHRKDYLEKIYSKVYVFGVTNTYLIELKAFNKREIMFVNINLAKYFWPVMSYTLKNSQLFLFCEPA